MKMYKNLKTAYNKYLKNKKIYVYCQQIDFYIKK